jgi:hypothetical protein
MSASLGDSSTGGGDKKRKATTSSSLTGPDLQAVYDRLLEIEGTLKNLITESTGAPWPLARGGGASAAPASYFQLAAQQLRSGLTGVLTLLGSKLNPEV